MATIVDLLPSEASIRIVADDGLETYIKKEDIIKVTPTDLTNLKFVNGGITDELYKIKITLADGSFQNLSLTSITNQPTWTPNQSGLNQAAYDISQTFKPAASPLDPLEVSITNTPLGVDLDTGAQLDAGSRLRVSQLNSLLDVKQIHDEQPLFIDREGTGTQVYNGKEGTTMSVTSGQYAIAQTFQRAPYFSGKSQIGEITFDSCENQANVTKRVGYFSSGILAPYDSDKDGIWFEADGTDYRLMIQNEGTEMLNVVQADWNIDTAPWFDPSKFNVMIFQFLYLGGTAIKIGFFDEGIPKWVHQYNHAGLKDGAFVKTPQQPVRYEIRSTGGSGSMTQICMQVSSEGSTSETGVTRISESENFQGNISGTYYGVIGIRLKFAYRDVRVALESLFLNARTNDDFFWYICVNPTVVGAGVGWSPVSNSAVEEFSGTVTNTVSDLGTIVTGGVFEGANSYPSGIDGALKIGSAINGTPDTAWLVIKPISGGLDLDSVVVRKEFL